MEIRKVQSYEAARVAEIFRFSARRLNAKGLYNWTGRYPSMNEAYRDAEAGTLYGAYQSGYLIGVITVDQSAVPEYETVIWTYPIEQSLLIHRLAVDPRYRHRGAARQMLSYASEIAAEQNQKALRIDSFSKNKDAVNLYLRQGFEIRGVIYYQNKDPRVREIPFYCMEKMIHR